MNTLSEDPVPTVSAVEVEPRTLPVPLASIPIVALVAFALVKRRDKLARIALAVAGLGGPGGGVARDLPDPSTGSSSNWG